MKRRIRLRHELFIDVHPKYVLYSVVNLQQRMTKRFMCIKKLKFWQPIDKFSNYRPFFDFTTDDFPYSLKKDGF